MKKIYFILLSCLFASQWSSADKLKECEAELRILPEISEMIMTDKFLSTLAPLQKAASQTGRGLKIDSQRTWNIGDQTFASANVYESINSEFPKSWTAIGEIIGLLEYGPQGEISVVSIFFKPAPEHP